jgi:hypothetical protein
MDAKARRDSNVWLGLREAEKKMETIRFRKPRRHSSGGLKVRTAVLCDKGITSPRFLNDKLWSLMGPG